MTILCSDIVVGAYRRLGLLPLGMTLTTDRANEGITAFNDVLYALQSEATTEPTPLALSGGDVINGAYSSAASTPNLGILYDLTMPYVSSSVFPLDAQYSSGMKALTAMELADLNGMQVPKHVQQAAGKCRRMLLGDYIRPILAQQDPIFPLMPSMRSRR
jgi:hypothetical protein